MRTPKTTLDQWTAFQAVVDQGGFAQAAQYLHRSQSAISYLVAKLQQQLSITLLQTKGRKAQLTEQGRALLQRSRLLTRQALELELLAAQLHQGWEAEIDLIVDAAFPTPLLMSILREFRPRSRGSRVQLQQVVLSGAEDSLTAGIADIALCARVPQGFIGESVLDIEFVAVAHPNHPLHRINRPLNTQDLNQEIHVVTKDSGSQPQDTGWISIDHRWTVSTLDAALSIVSSELGYCWLPRHLINEKIQENILKPLPLRQGGCYKAPLFLVYGNENYTGPATQLLAHIIQQACKEYQADNR